MAATLVAAADGRYLEGNDEALALLAVTLEELRASSIGDFSGPHADLARTVWAGLAGTGQAIPTGEATLYRADGSAIRVRYTAITRRQDGSYELQMVAVGPGGGPPLVDRMSVVLDEWRSAEREAKRAQSPGAMATSDALRTLYAYGARGRRGEDGR